jgi:recombinational DNA repair protein (RecF pathway)
VTHSLNNNPTHLNIPIKGGEIKDPHVHAEKTAVPNVGHAFMRNLIAKEGYIVSLPKTVTTGCGKRRPLVMTSTNPETITCLACREWMHADLMEWIQATECLLNMKGSHIESALKGISREELVAEVQNLREQALLISNHCQCHYCDVRNDDETQ